MTVPGVGEDMEIEFGVGFWGSTISVCGRGMYREDIGEGECMDLV
jgi:hypothetical protein